MYLLYIRPDNRFIVPKNVQRAETKVAYGPEGFPFLKGERYIYKYSFRAVEGMKLGKRFTHIGQIVSDSTVKMFRRLFF